ncbi:MAG TPA: putative Ig domain-containing protein [Acetobacteraceae bacterium]|nr:putative Ig domain-containing protein [Acetobacteraceae bacterium]
MSVYDNETAFVDSTATSISLAEMFGVTAGSSDPTYLVLTMLDRSEYTAGASGATGTLTGNGHTLSLSSLGGDGRGAGIVFTYQASTGLYYNSTYGYLNQLVYNSSSSAGDVTNLSLFGMSNLSEANSFASNPDLMMEVDASGYIGSATVVTSPGYIATVPAQATPDSIAAAANSLVGDAWNMDGCWVLASTISAEAGASLPVQSTLVGLPGQANGEWIVAFNGPAGQSGNWQSMVTAGEMIVFEPAGGGGHITTCVSGSGSTAMLVDNITYIGSNGQILNSANDGSSSDVLISAPHLASQEFAGVSASTVVIYELDTPIVTANVTSDSLACNASQSLGGLLSATDPANKAITSWQIYDTASNDDLVLNGTDYSDHSASNALTASSLVAVSLLAGASPTSDTLQVRAYNGSYWGDWTSLGVTIVPTAAPASAPMLESQTANQTWVGGRAFSVALPSGTFKDPQAETLAYAATLASGQALPSWLTFNATTDSFSGTAPTTAETLSIKVTAVDTSGLSVTDTFSAAVIGPPQLAVQTANQSWNSGKAFTLALPAGTFTDPQGETLTYSATQSNGLALPSWLTFNAAADTFSGTPPLTAETLGITVTATDSSGLAVSDMFSATVIGPPQLTSQTQSQTWTESKTFALTLPASTFSDPQGEKLTYSATLSNGQALPAWLIFNAASDSFSGTAPGTAQSLTVDVTATDTSGLSVSDIFAINIVAAASAPVVSEPTPSQIWKAAQSFSLALPSNTFTDPQGENLTYTATLTNGQVLPGWLKFNNTTDTFSGTPTNAAETLNIKVTAADTSGLSVSETFAATVLATPEVTAQTPNQSLTEGKAFSLALPANTFTDPQGETLTYTAKQQNGQPLPSWLQFNAATDTFSGTAPSTAQTLNVQVSATDTSGLTTSEDFAAVVQPPPAPKPGIAVTNATPGQTWTDGTAVGFTLPTNTFTDALGLKMSFAAYELSGPNATSWLYFNPTADELFGTVPATETGTAILAVVATDSQHMTAEDIFSVTFAPNTSNHNTATVKALGVVQQPDTTQVSAMLAIHT